MYSVCFTGRRSLFRGVCRWGHYWNSTSVEIPADATLERFYYAHSYLIGSGGRASVFSLYDMYT